MSIRTMAAHPLEATPRSNSYVTIQMRRGLESQMDKSKFLPAEFGATTDTKKLFFAFGAGDVQQLATYQNLEGLMAQALAGLEEEYLGSITQATQNAINATSQASSAATAANQAADEANEIIDAFKEAVDGTVISDSSPSSSTAYSSQKIENDFLKKTGNGSNVTVTFQQAAERAGIQSGDSLAVAFGKLAKFCADIQDYVFSPPVASLASTDATRPLAASMGKRLNDDFTAKYNNLSSALENKADKYYFYIQLQSQSRFGISKNFWLIDNTNRYGANNMSGYFYINDSTRQDWNNIPPTMAKSGDVLGIRNVYTMNIGVNTENILVEIIELYPAPGKKYYCLLNYGKWGDWKTITPN